MAASIVQSPRSARTEPEHSSQVIAFLKRSDVYPEKTRSVELIETHISWIFLTDDFAYKLKKPVRFDFLDFSTEDLRRVACEDEVKLNQRLAPGVYLGMMPIVRNSRGQLGLGQRGTPVDWVVRMRRLPAGQALDTMIRAGQVSSASIDQLAKRLADFYDNAPPVTMTVDGYRGSIERHVGANRDELIAGAHHLDAVAIRRTHSAQLRVLKLAPSMLDERVRNGRIVEGHGDLRPEHIYLTPSPLIIDCIEFSREFRTLDVVDELAFLAMECDFLGAEGLADPIFARYFKQSGDSPPQPLIDFYGAYRASVRAKVSVLRAEQLGRPAQAQLLESAGKYLELADRYSRTLGPPLLVLVRGLPGTGKSTMAQMISEQLGFDLLQTDVIRRELFGTDNTQHGFNEGRYLPENRRRVYQAMHEQAAARLRQGMSVVLDGTYLESALRREAADLSREHQADFLALQCRCADEILRQRIATRAGEGTSLSETRPEFLTRQQQAEQPDPPGLDTLVVDTTSGMAEPRSSIFAALRRRCFGSAV